jgi:hypothetical protein
MTQMSVETKQKSHRNPNPLMIQHPSRGLVCASSGHGKTHWIVDTALRKDAPWDAVHVICHDISMDQPAYKTLKQKFKNGPVTFSRGLPEGEEQENEILDLLRKDPNKQKLLILDDVLEESLNGRASKFVSKLFTSGRHLNCSVFQLLQRFMHARGNRLNCEYLICGPTPADVGSLAAIARQINPEDHGKHILATYRQATSKPHSFLIIDLKSADPILRLRDNSFDTVFHPNIPGSIVET